MQKSDQALRFQSLAQTGTPSCTLKAFVFELGQECKSVLHREEAWVMGRQSQHRSQCPLHQPQGTGCLLHSAQLLSGEKKSVQQGSVHSKKPGSKSLCALTIPEFRKHPQGLRVWSSLQWPGSQRRDLGAELEDLFFLEKTEIYHWLNASKPS